MAAKPLQALREAQPDPIDSRIVREIAMLREFSEDRDALLQGLFGGTLKRSPVRDELTREIVVAFGQGRTLSVADYQRLLARYGSPTGIGNAINELAAIGMVIKRPDGGPRRMLVIPTEPLLAFYRDVMPRLEDQVKRIFGIPPD